MLIIGNYIVAAEEGLNVRGDEDDLENEEDPMQTIEAHGWHVGKMLGEGAFGRVVLVTRATGDALEAACKIIQIPDDEEEREAIETLVHYGSVRGRSARRRRGRGPQADPSAMGVSVTSCWRIKVALRGP